MNMYSKDIISVINCILEKLENEHKNKSLKYYQNNPIKRTAYLTGISVSTIRKIQKISNEGEEIKIKSTKTKNNISVGRPKKVDDFDLDIIDRAMRSMFAKRQVVTLRRLKANLRTSFGLDLKTTTLWRAVKAKGELN